MEEFRAALERNEGVTVREHPHRKPRRLFAGLLRRRLIPQPTRTLRLIERVRVHEDSEENILYLALDDKEILLESVAAVFESREFEGAVVLLAATHGFGTRLVNIVCWRFSIVGAFELDAVMDFLLDKSVYRNRILTNAIPTNASNMANALFNALAGYAPEALQVIGRASEILENVVFIGPVFCVFSIAISTFDELQQTNADFIDLLNHWNRIENHLMEEKLNIEIMEMAEDFFMAPRARKWWAAKDFSINVRRLQRRVQAAATRHLVYGVDEIKDLLAKLRVEIEELLAEFVVDEIRELIRELLAKLTRMLRVAVVVFATFVLGSLAILFLAYRLQARDAKDETTACPDLNLAVPRYKLPEASGIFDIREEELRSLNEILAKSTSIAALTGIPGVGKSRIAKRFARDWQETPGKCRFSFWLECASPDQVANDYKLLADVLELKLDSAAQKKTTTMAAAIWDALSSFHPSVEWLLVFNNAPGASYNDGEFNVIRWFLSLLPDSEFLRWLVAVPLFNGDSRREVLIGPDGCLRHFPLPIRHWPNGRILFTTHSNAYDGYVPGFGTIRQVHVHKLNEESSMRLLLEGLDLSDATPEIQDDERAAARELAVDHFDGLPIAIIAARNYMQNKTLSLREYVNQLEIGAMDDVDTKVMRALETSLEPAVDAGCGGELAVAAFVNTDRIPLSLLGGDRQAIVDNLVGLGLLEKSIGSDYFSMHRLFQRAARRLWAPSQAFHAIARSIYSPSVYLSEEPRDDGGYSLIPHIKSILQHIAGAKMTRESATFSELITLVQFPWLLFTVTYRMVIGATLQFYGVKARARLDNVEIPLPATDDEIDAILRSWAQLIFDIVLERRCDFNIWFIEILFISLLLLKGQDFRPFAFTKYLPDGAHAFSNFMNPFGLGKRNPLAAA